MLQYRANITNSPADVRYPILDDITIGLSCERLDRLSVFLGKVQNLENPTVVTDVEILDIARNKSASYVAEYSEDTQAALGRLAAPDNARQLVEGGVLGATSFERPRSNNINSAYSEFTRAFSDECQSIGLSNEEVAELSDFMHARYNRFDQDLRNGLTNRLTLFSRLCVHFGNPDILRAEAASEAANSLANMAQKVRHSGPRPSGQSKFRKLGKILTGSIDYTSEQYDNIVGAHIDNYETLSPSEALEAYVQKAVVYYAKQVYGERPFILNRGIDSDPKHYYDTFQSHYNEGKVTKPLLPSEMLRAALRKEIADLLYSDQSDVSQFLDMKGNSYQKESRAWRKRFNVNDTQEEHQANYGNREHASDVTSGKMPQSQAARENRIKALHSDVQDLYLQYSRLVNSVRIASEFLPKLETYEDDFLTRLEAISDRGKSGPSLERTLLRALIDLHPDILANKDNDEAQDKFMFYSRLRDSLLTKTADYIESDHECAETYVDIN